MMTRNEEEKIEAIEGQEESKEITILESEYNALKEQTDEFRDKYLRLLAETENARKRMQKEREDNMRFAAQSVILDMLHPLDHMETALDCSDAVSDDVKHWATGFKMILTQFKDALAGHGVTAITSKGDMFDPHIHDAIEAIETLEHPEGTIIEELLKGYKIGERTLRPARVKVAKPPKDETESESTDSTEGEDMNYSEENNKQ